ncbi:MAG TPA: FGGY-family carbohydrate kinase [Bacillota bacterium]|nr:FGGY-family carbohydrate kinase [Bacillota bacterium]
MRSKEEIRSYIEKGNTSLGIELGSTRIKAVLIGPDHYPIASGSHGWENKLVDGIWTYDMEDIISGLQASYADLGQDVKASYGVDLETVGSMGVSAMMHGYMVFNKEEDLLVPFRTWRNTITAKASEVLIDVFNYPIPHRWSIAHLYQAILNGEDHVADISYMTTLAGLIHWKLTGKKAVGVGEASGMFPIDTKTGSYNQGMLSQFNQLVTGEKFPWDLEGILPEVLIAGEHAGTLTDTGARLLDPTGTLKSGIPFCPAEGDAGTGMTATNSVAVRTGNVSAGTSIFLMAVLERDLNEVHPEIDLVTTPAGDLVAMVHCNNCTSDIDAWAKVFSEFTEALGLEVDKPKIYDALYFEALKADKDGGGLLSYNYLSGESITSMDEGRPLFVRTPNSKFTLANFMRMNLYSLLATLRIGYDILDKSEGAKLDKLYGHGGLFITEGVGQSMMAAALVTPVSLMETAGEGGPWGMALLAAYMRNKDEGQVLEDYLSKDVFANAKESTVEPDLADIEGFKSFMELYRTGLPLEKKAIDIL